MLEEQVGVPTTVPAEEEEKSFVYPLTLTTPTILGQLLQLIFPFYTVENMTPSMAHWMTYQTTMLPVRVQSAWLLPEPCTMTMVPAKTQCPSSWTREYYGYLMAERENGVQFSQSSYTCIDITPDTVQGEAGDTAGTHFTYVVAACTDGIPCPQYVANRVISCAVCTK